MRQDIRRYSEKELSLLIFNEEYLYKRRHTRNFITMLEDLFIFTEEQLEVLKQDLIDDKEEGNTNENTN